MTHRALAMAALLAWCHPVAAEVVTHPARGQADSTATDARTRALDAAFEHAIAEVVAEIAPNVGAAAGEVEREILGRARRFVASFQVTKQTTIGGRLELEVAVRIDHDVVRARLIELGVATAEVAAIESARPRAVVLLRVLGPQLAANSWSGMAADDVPGLAAVTAALPGYEVVAASIQPTSDRLVPVDDRKAQAIAADVGAAIAVLVGIGVSDRGAVRGTNTQAVAVLAELRWLDIATGTVTKALTIRTGGWGTDEALPARAATAAAAALMAAIAPPTSSSSTKNALAVATATTGVTVHIRGPQPWLAASAVRTLLQAAPGVKRVVVAGIGARQVALVIDGATVANIADVVRGSADPTARIAVDGRLVSLELP